MLEPNCQKPELPLPTEEDFDPYEGDLDAQCAWRNFGGLSLAQAGRKFRECPESYQEDFMFMGGKAFAYYFPVVEAYLRDVPKEDLEEDDGDDHEAWILAHCIKNQFEAKTSCHVRHLKRRVIELSEFVLQNTRRFASSIDDQCRIADAWMELKEHLVNVKEE